MCNDPQTLCRDELNDLLSLESGISETDLNIIEQLSKIDKFTFNQINKIHDLWDKYCQ